MFFFGLFVACVTHALCTGEYVVFLTVLVVQRLKFTDFNRADLPRLETIYLSTPVDTMFSDTLSVAS